MATGLLTMLLAAAVAHGQTAPPSGQQPASKSPARTGQPRPAPSAASPKFEALAKKAAVAREANQLDEAIRLYQQALELRPSWAEGQWYLGTLHYELDHHAPARDAFRRVIASSEENGAAHAMKGLCEFQLKNYEGALADLTRAADLGVGQNTELLSVVRYHTAILLTRQQQYEFALLQLEPIAQQGNESPSVIEAMGLAALRIPLLPSGLSPDRREMVLLAGRGAYYQAIRVTTAAQRAYEQLVERYPDSPNTHYVYGTFLLQSQPEKAIEELKKELRISPGHVPAILQIAFEYVKQSNWEAARTWAAEAVAMAPNEFAGRRVLGQVLLELGDTAGAIEQLERGVKLASDSPSMRFMLARAYQRAGRTEDADRERLEFRRLERLVRSGRHGEQSVGGIQDAPQ